MSVNCSEITDNYFTMDKQVSFNWSVFGKRADINVEPDRSDVKGDGPYKYVLQNIQRVNHFLAFGNFLANRT